MEFEWSDRKKLGNIAKHGIDFIAAARVFVGPILEIEDQRRDYDQPRFLASGQIAGQVIHVV